MWSSRFLFNNNLLYLFLLELTEKMQEDIMEELRELV